jgi:hypothetical protein
MYIIQRATHPVLSTKNGKKTARPIMFQIWYVCKKFLAPNKCDLKTYTVFCIFKKRIRIIKNSTGWCFVYLNTPTPLNNAYWKKYTKKRERKKIFFLRLLTWAVWGVYIYTPNQKAHSCKMFRVWILSIWIQTIELLYQYHGVLIHTSPDLTNVVIASMSKRKWTIWWM